MKNVMKYSLFIFSLLFVLVSCKKDDNSSNAPSVSGTVTQGSWKITYFDDDGNDETSHFSGYSFVFNSNNTITANNGSNTVNGNWSNGNDDSQSKLVLDFGATVNFSDLNEDWHIMQQSSTLLKLQHVSGGNGGTKNLYFEKI